MEAVIQTNDLTRHFGDIVAVDALSLEIQRGEIFGLLGHNGAGKTTTVRLMNGVLNPTSGNVRVLGLSPVEQGAELRRRTGVLTETPALYEALSARANLTLFAEIYNLPKADVAQRVESMLAQFNLADRADEKVGGFSKGMKQRLALSRAFLHEPELLFLDEPTSGLDPIAARQVNDSILHASRDERRTVVLATHNLRDAQQMCDRVAVLEHGRLVALGKPAELARELVQARTVLFHVELSQAAQAEATLQDYAESVSTDDAGGALTAQGLVYDRIPDAVHALAIAGIRVYQVSPQEPTLEDVYFTLHQVDTEAS
ncbi:MAG: ABC transporter ATP-binding protein [Anaerolineaceae bacterium]|nr:MAG: ABC transporter ATP-binding protein [Anaerolineaceae bacterium]